ncbi:hypothetical protein [Hafnia alvei]|nr:hypothetical protein [Hafnia alvei]QQE44514.1 hypothetical protein I6H95_04135 [Hafnia alvei]
MNKSKTPVNATLMAAPYVTGAEDGTIDASDVNFGVQCEISMWANPNYGDRVSLFWGELERVQFLEDTTRPLIYDIKDDFNPSALSDGFYDVYYTVFDGINTSTSEVTSVSVQAHLNPGSLAAPDIVDADDDGAVGYDEAVDGVDIHVNYTGMAEGDIIALKLQGFDDETNAIKEDYTAPDYTVTTGDISAGYALFTVPYTGEFENIGENAYAECWYSVTVLADNSHLSSQVTKIVVDVVPPYGH